MREVLTFLADNIATALIVLAVAILLVVAWVVIVLRRGRRADGSDGVGEGEEDETPAPVTAITQTADLELSFRRALKTLKASTGGAGFRYRVPWYLMLGPSGTGKTTLLETAPLPRRVELDSSGPPSSKTCGWHFFDGGVVLDVAGSLVLKKDLSHDEVGWRRLLSLLKRHRPERPIDGAILTLSAADLLEWEDRPADELRKIGVGLFRRLHEAQRELGVRFPIYVVLTNADRLPGFSSFVRAIPRRFHQDVFGWSSPYAIDAAFRPDWVDEGLAEVGTWLQGRSAEALASRSLFHDADAVFRFPDVAKHLVPAARAILSEVFEESAYHEGFFLRGIYFTGHVQVDRLTTQDADGPEDPTSDGVGEEELSVFLGRLFEKKIFPERGLARGFARGILDRNRTIRWIQIAAAALVIIGVPGMWLAQANLSRQAQPLEELLGAVHADLTLVAPRSGAGALNQAGAETVVLSLLHQMAGLDAGPFWSLFIPSSWVSDLDQDITENLTQGFQQVILPTLRRGIVEWADTLTDPTWATSLGGRVLLDDASQAAGDSERLQEYEVLVGYLEEIVLFVTNAERFNQLSRSDSGNQMQLFSELFTWYYEEELEQAFFDNAEFYEQALRSASERPVSAADWRGVEEATASMASILAERFYVRLVDAVRGLEQSLAGTVNPAFTASDLREVALDVAQVHDLLTSSDNAWFDSAGPMVPILRVMLDSIPNTGPFAKSTFVDRFTEEFREVRGRQLANLFRELDLLARALQPPVDSLGQPAPQATATQVDLAPQLGALRGALTDLLSRDFMMPVGAGEEQMRPGIAGRPTWSMPPLDEALAYFTEYQSFRDGALTQIPPGLQSLVLGVAGRSLEERVRWSLSRSMTYELGVGPEGREGREEGLRNRLAGFDQASRRLVGMLERDDQVGRTPAGTAVAETIILEGADLLNEIDVLLLRDRLYDPVNGSLAAWQGDRPASLAGFGVPSADALEEYLGQQRATLRSLALYAAPVLAYLALPPVADLLRSHGSDVVPTFEPLLQRWRGIVRTFDEYENKTPGNSLEALDQFVRQDMAVASLSECSSVALPDPGAAQDYFDVVRGRLGIMLHDRCRELARLALLDGFDQMSRFFSTRLAGRFPFVDLAAEPDAVDASVADVRSFLQMYDAIAVPLSGSTAAVADLLGGEVPADFFRQMAEIRAFLAPVLLADPEGVSGALQIRTRLRTNRSSERGADQIVEWSFAGARAAITYRGSNQNMSVGWRLGDPVSVSLTWASESLRRPVRDPSRADMSVEGATVTWRYGGPWSLLRLVAAHRPADADLSGSLRDDRATVNLRVLTRSRDALVEPQDVRDARASVFLRLSFSGSVGGAELQFPDFPVRVASRPSR